MNKKLFKKCPRCNRKCPINQPVCDGCGLIFSRMKYVSNSAGKEALERDESNKVIYDKTLPYDVNKWNLFFTALFLGFLGVQFEKVGRKKAFLYYLISFSLFFIFSILLAFGIITPDLMEAGYLGLFFWMLILPPSLGLVFWAFSFISILLGTFKVPVAIDEKKAAIHYGGKVASEILDEAIKTRKVAPKRKKVSIKCKSCGKIVKVNDGEKICPKCDGNLEG